MEVESQTLSNFDLKSKPPFSYPMNLSLNSSDLHSQECNSFDLPDFSHTHEKSPENGVTECPNTESSVKSEVADESPELETGLTSSSEFNAAVKMQKLYRGYRTRRRLADSAIVAEELWWQAIDFARLNRSTVSFFNFSKPETATSRWSRISLNASKVGKGLSKDAKAQKLAFQHWIEAIDPRHRYGHSLHLYYQEWSKVDADQPFFYWLDIGDGKELDLEECPRSKLRQQCIKYLGPQERENYEYIIAEGKIIHKQTGNLMDTFKGSKGVKWIFVMSTSKKLYSGQKKKGVFHHSSFLAGGATLAAGRLVAEHGVLKSISAYSGHYRPTDDSLGTFLSFLSENGVNLDEVEIHKANEDYDSSVDGGSGKLDISCTSMEVQTDPEPPKLEPPKEESAEPTEAVAQADAQNNYKRTLSGALQSPRAEVPKKAILQRINSKKEVHSYQLGHQLSLKWSTGAGPRIGCVADYPVELRVHALELVNLSPRHPPTPLSATRMGGLASPTALAGDLVSGV